MNPCVSVCVCTYKRPHVAQTIRSVLRQEGIGPRAIEIVVVDDDPESSAKAIVEAIAATTPLTIRYVHSGAQNVAMARNACLASARGNCIAFIDDDQIAEPDWLSGLVAARVAHGADVVKGFVRAVYPPGTPNWVRIADPYTRDYGPTGASPTTIATGNVLFSRKVAERHQLRFNPAFGRSGGEDTEFFSRFLARDAKIVSSRDAIVNEIIPDSRITRVYFASRYKRMGQNDGLKMRLGLSSRSPIARLSVAAAAVAVLWSYPLWGLIGSRLTFKAFAKFWYSVGILQGILFGRARDMAENG